MAFTAARGDQGVFERRVMEFGRSFSDQSRSICSCLTNKSEGGQPQIGVLKISTWGENNWFNQKPWHPNALSDFTLVFSIFVSTSDN